MSRSFGSVGGGGGETLVLGVIFSIFSSECFCCMTCSFVLLSLKINSVSCKKQDRASFGWFCSYSTGGDSGSWGQVGPWTGAHTCGLSGMVVSGESISYMVAQGSWRVSQKAGVKAARLLMTKKTQNILCTVFYWSKKSLRPTFKGRVVRFHLSVRRITNNF